MDMENKKKEKGYRVVSTKISREAHERLHRLARKKGMSVYDLMQMVCDTLIRYMDDRHNLSPEMERAMSVFEHMVGWREAFNLAEPSASPEVREATYYLSAGGRQGVRAVHVEQPFFGRWTQTENVQQILERSFCLTFPERYRRLRAMAVDMGCSSLLELLDVLLDHHALEADMAELRRDFEDADRSEYGRKPADSPYRRKHRRGVTDMEGEPGFLGEL